MLSDAVALVRGDRFYTVSCSILKLGAIFHADVLQIDYHPKNLTNWGYAEVQVSNLYIDPIRLMGLTPLGSTT